MGTHLLHAWDSFYEGISHTMPGILLPALEHIALRVLLINTKTPPLSYSSASISATPAGFEAMRPG
jgi:hypothetical protein